MKYFIDKLLDIDVLLPAALVFFLWGVGYILITDLEIKAERDAREDTQIVELVKSGTSLPEARCAVKGC